MKIKIILAGPRGKMGSEAIAMIQKEENLELVACIDRKNNHKTLSDIGLFSDMNVPIYEDPNECFMTTKADVLIDLTVPEIGYKHTLLAIENNIRPVVGTSGFTSEQLEKLSQLSLEKEVGCIIAPNFAIGAVLMMKFSQLAAKYLPDVEIIEKHHDQKVDAPSGTAVKTLDLIKEVRKEKDQGHPDEKETMSGARGAEDEGMRVHSVRLPGLVAHQEVILGGEGQTLSIKHDSLSRESFMSGIKIAVESVMKTDTLIYGLENIIDL